MSKKKISKITILIPVYNEEATISKCLDNVINSDTLGIPKEIIISDNNSTDGTKKILQNLEKNNVKILYKDKNEGKGSNIKNALPSATRYRNIQMQI